MKKSHLSNLGFTLVELAIVIVIIGLLVGGVLQGQELIRQAEIRSAIKDFEGYKAAYYTFKSKYNFVPGDSATAANFIGGAVNCATNCMDGYFGRFNAESIIALNNLSAANMIKGRWPGTQASPATGGCTKTECPTSSLRNMIYFAVTNNSDPLSTTMSYSATRRNGILVFEGINIDNGGGGVTPEVSFQIDTKVDDGIPGTGYLMGVGDGGWFTGSGWANCATTSVGEAYNLTLTTPTCRPFYILE